MESKIKCHGPPTHTHTYTYYLEIKKEIPSFERKWIELEICMENEICLQNDISFDIKYLVKWHKGHSLYYGQPSKYCLRKGMSRIQNIGVKALFVGNISNTPF